MQSRWFGFAIVGGNWNNGSNAGMFYWNFNNDSSNTNSNIGSRLLMVKNKNTFLSLALAKNKSRTDGVSRETETPIDDHKKMKRYNHIFEKIVDEENIRNAIHKASKRKRKRASVIRILSNEDKYIKIIQDILINRTYYPSPYIVQKIYDGSRKKERTIYKPRFFPDQVIHWALMLQLESILGKRFYHYSCASLKGKGSKLAFKGTKKALRSPRTKYCLKLDIQKYYPSVDREILKQKFRRVIKDEDTLWLLDTIIDGNETQGDGIPIGNYTSQWFANFYLDSLDKYIKEDLKVKHYIRYMDDMVIFHSNKRELWKIKEMIELYLQSEHLRLKRNWQMFVIEKRFLDFLGFRFYRDHITLRRCNFLRIKRRFKKIYKKRGISFKDACAVVSYNGMLKCSDCNTYLRKYLYPYISLKKCRRVISNENRKQYIS